LSDSGFIIYPGKISRADTFRIGTIGQLFESDLHQLLAAVRHVIEAAKIIMSPVNDLRPAISATSATNAKP
jgi:2-aminoethylphosphonate-pyruvate transaminase